jgi:hypothetical protein
MRLDISAYSARRIKGDQLKADRKEIVRVRPRLTTNAAFAFTAADISAAVRFSGITPLSRPA